VFEKSTVDQGDTQPNEHAEAECAHPVEVRRNSLSMLALRPLGASRRPVSVSAHRRTNGRRDRPLRIRSGIAAPPLVAGQRPADVHVLPEMPLDILRT
jgi:hypothetical protein